jgi:hypothetical protein
MATSTLDPVSPPASQEEQVHALDELLRRQGRARLIVRGGELAIELPDAIDELLLRIFDGMQQGKAISIVPVVQELTTQQAAALQGVFRPFFCETAGIGRIAFPPYRYTPSRVSQRHAGLQRTPRPRAARSSGSNGAGSGGSGSQR